MVSISAVPSLVVEVQDLEYVPRAGDTDFPQYGNATKWPVVLRDLP